MEMVILAGKASPGGGFPSADTVQRRAMHLSVPLAHLPNTEAQPPGVRCAATLYGLKAEVGGQKLSTGSLILGRAPRDVSVCREVVQNSQESACPSTRGTGNVAGSGKEHLQDFAWLEDEAKNLSGSRSRVHS